MKNLITIVLCVCCFGCATAYQPKSMTGGFYSTKIQEGIYKVVFEGNGYTRQQRAIDYALLRCAEVTLEEDYNYFIILDDTNSSRESFNVTEDNIYNYSRPTSANTIKCFVDKPPINDLVYDAKQLVQNLRDQYQL